MSIEKYSKKKDLTPYDLIKSNLELAFLKAVSVVPSQPAHVIMRHQQKKPFLTIRAAYQEIAQGNSKLTFFKGAGLGVTKEIFKNTTYKGALIKGAPTLADKSLPSRLSEHVSPTAYHLMQSIVAGHIAGFADATFGGPLEFCATYTATSQGKEAQASLLRKLRSEGLLCLYQGYKPTLLKGNIAFSTFFLCSSPIQSWTQSMYSIEYHMPTPWYCTATSAVVCGFAVALTSSALDIVKTQSQSPKALDGTGGVKEKNEGVLKIMHNNYKQHGMKGITAGMPLKTLMITMGWAIAFFATQCESEAPKSEIKMKLRS